MPCKICKIKPVIQLPNSNVKLCKTCFFRYFEKKVLKTIRTFNLFDKRDKVLVAISGGKDSLTILNIMKMVDKKIPFKNLEAIAIDNGIKNYKALMIKNVKEFCKKYNIKLHLISFKKEFGYTLDQLTKKIKLKPYTIYSILHRQILNKYSRKLKATKLVTAHNLDDEAQAVLMNFFKHNIDLTARLGPITGVTKHEKFIPRIKPLYFLTEFEVIKYANLKGFVTKNLKYPYLSESYRDDVRIFLSGLEKKYPGTKHALIKSFIEILPLLKGKYKTNKKINICEKCGEPTSSKICQVCNILKTIK